MASWTALLFRGFLGVAACRGLTLSLPKDEPKDDVKTTTVPRFVVDLDVAPERRWTNVTKYWRQVEQWGPSPLHLPPIVYRTAELFLPPALKEYLRIVKSQVDDEYMREIRGIVQEAASPLVFEDGILLRSMGYSLITVNEETHDLELCFNIHYGCSALLAVMPNGTVVQGRNLDMLHGRELTSKTAEVIFVRDGRPLYSSVVWPQQIFVHTAIRYGGWAFQQNTRSNMSRLSLNLEAMRKGGQDFGQVARKLMETVDDFDTVVRVLNETKFAAPQYFIVSGAKPWQGAVISVDRADDHHSFTPAVRFLRREAPGGWHIVQTNDDYNRDAEDVRRPVEETALRAFNQEQVSPDWVMGQMTKGVLFTNATLSTSVYVPATGYDETVAHVGNGISMLGLRCNSHGEDLN